MASSVLVVPVQAQERVPSAQSRPRGEPTMGLLRGDKAEQLTRDLQTLVGQEVAARGLVDDIAPLEEPAIGSDKLAGLAWWDAPAPEGALSLKSLIDETVRTSIQIGVFAELPAIRETSVGEAQGRYVPEAFAEARYSSRDEPTSSLAQTRGSSRLKDRDTALEFGVRTRLQTGAEMTLSQRLSNLSTNLIDYAPRQQSRSRTVVSVVQPLLREAGVGYNTAVLKIARLETDASAAEFARQAESHLLEVARSYWTLYLARAVLDQQRRAFDGVNSVAKRIEGRKDLDSQTLQVNRARAVSAERRAALVRAENAVRNAEARMRALVNSPRVGLAPGSMIVPADRPGSSFSPVGLKTLASDALANRPEVKQAVLSYRAALLREGMAVNDALPRLDAVVEASVNGGGGNFAWGDSFNNAYGESPSWLAGLRFAVPLGYDERKARRDRRRIESNQSALQLRAAVETVILDAEVSSNEYKVAYTEMFRRAEALDLAQADLKLLGDRYAAGVGLDIGNGIFALDRLLDAQMRVAAAERELAEARATFELAQLTMRRARGTLLADLGYAVARTDGDDGLPRYVLAPPQAIAAQTAMPTVTPAPVAEAAPAVEAAPAPVAEAAPAPAAEAAPPPPAEPAPAAPSTPGDQPVIASTPVPPSEVAPAPEAAPASEPAPTGQP